ncbi:MAG: RecX family transcriptional regulator [Deltaproteobacteria bacterium]|nr:RecX family transcriptional regulator [Deltaproteobacteria bacterium]
MARRRSRSIASESAPRSGSDGDARAVALRLLARAPRSAAEIETQLARRHFTPATIADTLLRLRDLRYLDDAALARRRAEELLLRRGHGRLRVAHELTRRGVADRVVEAAVAAVMEGRCDVEIARLALHRKFGHDPLPDASARARAYRFLIGRGHLAEAVREILGDDDSR